MMGDNNKNLEFKYLITIGLNDDGTFAFKTNVASLVLGLGMLELGKEGMEQHIANLKKKEIVPGGIMNFVRGGKK